MFETAAIALCIAMFMGLIRLIKGPSIYDRILAVNMFGTQIVLLIAVLGFMSGRPEWLDIALVYALSNFISVIAISKFLSYRRLGDAEDDDPSHEEGM